MIQPRIIVFLVAVALSHVVFAELTPDPNLEMIKRMQAQREAERMEEEFRNPKTAELPKEKAVLGKRSAPISIVEYSDFQCPYCKVGAEIVEKVRKKHGGKVMVMFKHFPLNFHPFAMLASKRFEAIAMKSSEKAYAFHDELFKNQERLTKEGEKVIDEAVKKLGFDPEKIKADSESDVVKKRIEADMKEAEKFGIQGTPAYLVSGVLLRGAYPEEKFDEIIERRLAEKKAKK